MPSVTLLEQLRDLFVMDYSLLQHESIQREIDAISVWLL